MSRDLHTSSMFRNRVVRSALRGLGCLALLSAVLIGNEIRLAHPVGQARAEVYLQAMNAVKAARNDLAEQAR